MSTTLEAKLRAQASAYAPLTALLGSSPFPWYDTQLKQGSTPPAIRVLLVSNPQVYCNVGRLPTSFARVQFQIWDTDPQRGRAVEAALFGFFDTFNAVGPSGLPSYPVEVIDVRGGYYPLAEPPYFLRDVDARIFQNQNL